MKLTRTQPTKKGKTLKVPDPAVVERQQKAAEHFEATHPIEAKLLAASPVEAAPAPAPAKAKAKKAAPVMGDVVLSPTVLLNAEILEKPELAGSIRAATVTEAINSAIEKFDRHLVVYALQSSIRGLGERMAVDRKWDTIGSWTCSRINRVDPTKLVSAFHVALANEVAAAQQAAQKQAEQVTAPQPQPQGPQQPTA
jgi:hypothetical protein